MVQQFTFTKASVDRLKLPQNGRVEYQDAENADLRLRVSASGNKTFSVLKRVSGRLERVTICKAWEMSLDDIRKKAVTVTTAFIQNDNPAEAKRVLRAEYTLAEMFDEYLVRHCETKGIKTVDAMRENFRRYLGQWSGRKLSKLTHDEVAKHHGNLGREIGHHTANRTVELLSAVYNKAIAWGIYGKANPAAGIEKFSLQSRERFLHSDELPKFFEALADEPSQTMRDFFLLSLLTGARQSNVLAMRWENISIARAEWFIPETKNGDPQTVTLSPEALEVLRNRQSGDMTGWVFPSDRESKTGHLQNPKKAWRKLLDRAGIADLRMHDLRRTLGSWQVRTGASLSIIGKSLNHKNTATTAIYARLDTDPVRQSVNTATAAMMEAAGVKDAAELIPMKRGAN